MAVETSLHRQLKERYGPAAGGRVEVVLRGYRIDAIAPDGALVEVQSGSLRPLRAKLDGLLPDYRVRVIKPVVVLRRVVRRAIPKGADLSARLSPKRGDLVDVFDDLIGLVSTFPNPNLTIEVLAVEIDEIRIPRRRWPSFTVADRRLQAVVKSVSLREPRDLWSLLPPDVPSPFTTRILAEMISRPIDLAQRVAYCLRLSGAATTIGKSRNHRLYEPRFQDGCPAGSIKTSVDRVSSNCQRTGG